MIALKRHGFAAPDRSIFKNRIRRVFYFSAPLDHDGKASPHPAGTGRFVCVFCVLLCLKNFIAEVGWQPNFLLSLEQTKKPTRIHHPNRP